MILAGANRPHAREADDALISRSTIYVDRREGCLTRAGDLSIPLASGALKPEQIVGEIGTLFKSPLTAPPGKDVTMFKSIGVIAQDIALAQALYHRARERGVGVEFDAATGETPALHAAQKEAS